MSTNSDSGNRGASIRPSARPPIHSPRGLNHNPIEMGKHGLHASPRSEPQTSPGRNTSDQGRDEVDNVMSKFARSSPLRNPSNRRLSIDEQYINHSKSDATDDDSSQENVRHATSLPTRLSNHTYEGNMIQMLNREIILERAHAIDRRFKSGILERDISGNSSSSQFRGTSQSPKNREIILEGAHAIDRGFRSGILERDISGNSSSSQFRGTSHSPNNRSRSYQEQSTHEDLNNSRLRTANNQSTRHGNSGSNGGTSIRLILAAIVGILALFMGFKYSNTLYGIWQGNATENKSYSYNRKEFSKDLYHLGENYKIDGDSILKLESGLAIISEKADAGSFIFVYNSNALNFDATKFNKFINEISSKAAKYLRNDITSVQHVEIEGSKLNMKTHSELMNRYREEVNQSGVMLVKGIDEIPSSLAMAFHYYCDEYSPVAKKSAILFTLDITKCNEIPDKLSIHRRIEKCLTNKWSGVPSDNIAPLLTRVVDVVVDVTRG